MKCRHCGSPLEHTFLDLGFAPPSNAYLTKRDLQRPEIFFPLKVKVCDLCWLVQTEDYTDPNDLFRSDYSYFSSTSVSWLAHAAEYANKITKDLLLNGGSFVIEIASNDGYLLKNFLAAGVPCLGIEPTCSTAQVAERLGIPVWRKFFSKALGKQLAVKGRQADLIIGNNVYAHVPDINDFTLGLKEALKPNGTITLEFPHLMKLMEHAQFDTIYHEHFSYLSLFTVCRIFSMAGLRVFDVEELPTHGGSIRIYGCHVVDCRPTKAAVNVLLNKEKKRGLQTLKPYQACQVKANRLKNDLLMFLVEQKRAGKRVAAYGAAAKGNTILNYAGVKTDLLDFVSDGAKAKQGKFMPGSHIPILPQRRLLEVKPDFVLILPWNIKEEVISQLNCVQAWGGKFVVAVPKLKIVHANR